MATQPPLEQVLGSLEALDNQRKAELEKVEADQKAELASHYERKRQMNLSYRERLQKAPTDEDYVKVQDELDIEKNVLAAELQAIEARHSKQKEFIHKKYQQGVQGLMAASPVSSLPISQSSSLMSPGVESTTDSHVVGSSLSDRDQNSQQGEQSCLKAPAQDVNRRTMAPNAQRAQNALLRNSVFQLAKPISCKVAREPIGNNKERLMLRVQNKGTAGLKRKASGDAPIAKRSRVGSTVDSTMGSTVGSTVGTTTAATSTVDPDGFSEGSFPRTITYEEVRRNGQQGTWDTIVEFPRDTNRFFILYCKEHQVWFTTGAIRGAAKHLSGLAHGFPNRAEGPAVRELGYRVIDCTKELADIHNNGVKKAIEQGYVPANKLMKGHGRKSFGKKPVEKEESTEPATNPTKKPKKSSSMTPTKVPTTTPKDWGNGITHPKTFYIYWGLWPEKDKSWGKYPVLILGWDDQEPGGLRWPPAKMVEREAAGLDTRYRLSDTDLLKSNRPRCYIYKKNRIVGWTPGYEDDGPLVENRQFPVMFFDGKLSTGWLDASHLAKFPLYETEIPKTYAPRWERARYHIVNRERAVTGYGSWAQRERARQENRFAPWKPEPCVPLDDKEPMSEDPDYENGQDEEMKDDDIEAIAVNGGDQSSDDDYPGDPKVDAEGDVVMNPYHDKEWMAYQTRSKDKPSAISTPLRPVNHTQDSSNTSFSSPPVSATKSQSRGMEAARKPAQQVPHDDGLTWSPSKNKSVNRPISKEVAVKKSSKNVRTAIRSGAGSKNSDSSDFSNADAMKESSKSNDDLNLTPRPEESLQSLESLHNDLKNPSDALQIDSKNSDDALQALETEYRVLPNNLHKVLEMTMNKKPGSESPCPRPVSPKKPRTPGSRMKKSKKSPHATEKASLSSVLEFPDKPPSNLGTAKVMSDLEKEVTSKSETWSQKPPTYGNGQEDKPGRDKGRDDTKEETNNSKAPLKMGSEPQKPYISPYVASPATIAQAGLTVATDSNFDTNTSSKATDVPPANTVDTASVVQPFEPSGFTVSPFIPSQDVTSRILGASHGNRLTATSKAAADTLSDDTSATKDSPQSAILPAAQRNYATGPVESQKVALETSLKPSPRINASTQSQKASAVTSAQDPAPAVLSADAKASIVSTTDKPPATASPDVTAPPAAATTAATAASVTPVSSSPSETNAGADPDQVTQQLAHELSYYKNADTIWERVTTKDGCLKLFKSADAKTLYSQIGNVAVKIEPEAVRQVEWVRFQESSEQPGTTRSFSRLTLIPKDFSSHLGRTAITFDRSPDSSLTDGIIQTRDFMRWMQKINPRLRVQFPKPTPKGDS